MCVIADHEDVARAVFSPKMVYRGMILPAAFELRPQMAEEYLSVMRMSFNSWKDDILRRLVGGRPLLSIQDRNAQDFMLLSIRQELVRIAQKRLTQL